MTVNKDEYNPLTNSGHCKDETYRMAVAKASNIHTFFYGFTKRLFNLANKELEKRYNIKILKIVFWDMETNRIRHEKGDKYE